MPRGSARSGRRAGRKAARGQGRVTPRASGRYTPPIPREKKVSPRWVPVLMFSTLGLGLAMIVLNYLTVLPGSASTWYLLGGIGLIFVGFVTATTYR
jgi:hypothetical protein